MTSSNSADKRRAPPRVIVQNHARHGDQTANDPKTRRNNKLQRNLRQRQHRLKLAVRGFWGGWIYGPIRYRSWEFCEMWLDQAIYDLKRAIMGETPAWLKMQQADQPEPHHPTQESPDTATTNHQR